MYAACTSPEVSIAAAQNFNEMVKGLLLSEEKGHHVPQVASCWSQLWNTWTTIGMVQSHEYENNLGAESEIYVIPQKFFLVHLNTFSPLHASILRNTIFEDSSMELNDFFPVLHRMLSYPFSDNYILDVDTESPLQ
eukprot:Sdes_comp13232_c0_seq1m3111